MAMLIRKNILASTKNAFTKTISRSLKTSAKNSSNNLLLGACTAGVATVGTAALFGCVQSKDNEHFKSLFSPFYLTKSNFLSGSIWAPVVGTVYAEKKDKKKASPYPPCTRCKKKSNCLEPQKNVITPNKTYSLYLWISLDSCADKCEVAKIASDLDCLLSKVDASCDPNQGPVIAGVGFGPTFYSQVRGKTNKGFYYGARKCTAGELPHTDGDIFLHVKGDDRGKLLEICTTYVRSFPEGAITEFEDIYGYSYNCCRDLSGFCINTSNRPTVEGMKELAVECETGGSYALAMKWVHDFETIRPENNDALEKFIGRDLACNELATKSVTSHVARMRGSAEFNAAPCHEVVMQKQSYGTLSHGAGLFVLGFSRDPECFEFMLDQMVGACCDGCFDDVFQFSENVKGTYFYFPGLEELNCMKEGK